MSSSNHLRYNVDDKSLSLSVAVSNVMQADLFYMSDPDTNTLMFRSAIEYEERLCTLPLPLMALCFLLGTLK